MDSHPRCAVNKECNIEETRRVASLIDVSGRWDMNAFNLPFPSNEVYRIQKLTPYIWSDKWIMDSHPRCTVNKECNIEVCRIQKLTLGRGADRNIWAYTEHGSMIEGAWISRDHEGNVLHHSRYAVTPAHNLCYMETDAGAWKRKRIEAQKRDF
ncbi:hypothetical protein F2Q68_00011094 [Brassica cretica]|uniref:Uncharacterized protein n=1 Tax=Brassica cretica TaxID=69181 RepID=A0A8S9KMV6_BRACR|nr:hypothetical protein F2Q68_00011094 [Brassica cretica]